MMYFIISQDDLIDSQNFGNGHKNDVICTLLLLHACNQLASY